MIRDFGDDDGEGPKKRAVWKEFECPTCDAMNPMDDGFKVRDEVFCFYCGADFKVKEYENKLGYKLVPA